MQFFDGEWNVQFRYRCPGGGMTGSSANEFFENKYLTKMYFSSLLAIGDNKLKETQTTIAKRLNFIHQIWFKPDQAFE